MDHKLKELDWDPLISKTPIFTEEDKVKIREHLHLRKYKKNRFVPAMLSVAVLSMIFVGLTGIILNELGIINLKNGTGNSMGSNIESQTAVFRYMDADQELLKTYYEFKEQRNDNILNELTPREIFILYFYATALEDFETRFLLYNHNPSIGDKISLKQYVIDSKKNVDQLKQFIGEFEHYQLKEVIVDSTHAYIEIDPEKGLGFSLTKDHNGIWKANWMPLQ